MESRIEFVVQNRATGSRIKVYGEVTADTGARLGDFVIASCRPDHHVVVDLSEVRRIDAAGIATLMELHARHRDDGGTFTISGTGEGLLKVLDVGRSFSDELDAAARLINLATSDADFRLVDPPQPEVELLSPKQRQVLLALAAGMTVAEAGEALYLSANTIKTHIAHILKRLGASNRTQAVAIVVARDRTFLAHVGRLADPHRLTRKQAGEWLSRRC